MIGQEKPQNPEAKTKEIKIHLGFMPEEVASVLKPIINNRMGSDAAAQTPDNESIIIISRGDIKDDLFEQFVSNFGIQQYNEVSSTLTAEPGSAAVCDKIASTIGQFLNGADLQASLIAGAKTKMQEHMADGKPNISVGRIGTGPVTRICIQLPEMGFQSDLAAVYTMGMVDAIAKHALDPTIPVTVSSYGAGGSAHEDLVPGQMNNCDAVLNLRTHIDLAPQVNHLVAVVQNLGRADLQSELEKLKNYSELLLRQDADINHNVLQREIIRIRNDLIDKGVSGQSLKLPKDHVTKYYTEIAISNPTEGKRVFYKTASFTDRAIAEESAHLMLLNFGKMQSPNLTTGYINFLKQSNPEYKKLVEILDKSNKGIEIEQKINIIDEQLRAKLEERFALDGVILTLQKQLGVANISLRSSARYVAPEIPFSEQIVKIKEKIADLTNVLLGVENQITELRSEMRNLEDLCDKFPIDEQAKTAIEQFHQQEIQKLKVLGQNGYFADSGLSDTRFKNSNDAQISASYADATRTYLMDALAPETEGFSHNFAASMFIGAQTKEAVKNLTEGQVIADVNMEDDIVADIIHMVITKKIGNEDELGMNMNQFAMARVHCDPFTITHQVEEQFQAWCKEKKVNNNYFVDAVMWGLKGFTTDALTETAKWDFVDKLKAAEPKIPDVDKLFFEHNGVVVDPFWREIGTDFLADIKNGRAIPFTNEERNNPEVKALLSKLKAESEAISNLMRSGAPEMDVRAKVAGLVTAVLSHPKMKMFNEKENNYGVWARVGSWGGNPQANVGQISFNGSSIDRAFYVSSNMNALTKGGQEIVNDATKKQALKSDMIVSYREPKSQESNIPAPPPRPDVPLGKGNQRLAMILERVEYYKELGQPAIAAAEAKQALNWAKGQNTLDKQLLDQLKLAAGEPITPLSVAPVAQNGTAAPAVEQSLKAPEATTRKEAVTYAKIRDNKVSGPKELERLKKIEDPVVRAQEAQKFIQWSEKHNRHFNPPAMAEIKKIAAIKGKDQENMPENRPGSPKQRNQ